MRIYKVGGAVRDELLGIPPQDHDWVVVGATPDQLRAQGFIQVGADFPVFLHPTTKEEYALARLERKIAPGYKGFQAFFDPSVTIEQDLSRRDLTINAIAQDPQTGELVDPFGGVADLRSGVLRHVSEAFSEDPLRVLRVARMQAKTGFSIHPATFALCAALSRQGALDELARERLGVELQKLWASPHPAAGMRSLRDMGALEALSPGWGERLSPAWLDALAEARSLESPGWALFALSSAAPDADTIQALGERLRLPNDFTRMSARAARSVELALEPLSAAEDPVAVRSMALIEAAHAHKLSEPDLLAMGSCCDLMLRAREASSSERLLLQRAFGAARAYAQADLSQALQAPPRELPSSVAAARLRAVASALGGSGSPRPKP